MDNFKTRQAQVAERSVFLNRILFSSLAILLLGGLIISRLIYLMVIESDELSLRSVNNTLRIQSIPAPRGLILDRNIASPANSATPVSAVTTITEAFDTV